MFNLKTKLDNKIVRILRIWSNKCIIKKSKSETSYK